MIRKKTPVYCRFDCALAVGRCALPFRPGVLHALFVWILEHSAFVLRLRARVFWRPRPVHAFDAAVVLHLEHCALVFWLCARFVGLDCLFCVDCSTDVNYSVVDCGSHTKPVQTLIASARLPKMAKRVAKRARDSAGRTAENPRIV